MAGRQSEIRGRIQSAHASGSAQKRFTVTLDYGGDERWLGRAKLIAPAANLFDELRVLIEILARSRKESALVFDSSHGKLHPDVLAAALLGFLPTRMRPPGIMIGCMWNRDPGLSGKIQEIIARLADRAIDLYAVQSKGEMSLFPRTWGVSESKMRYCPYFRTISKRDFRVPEPPPGKHIFAGGNSHRDYELVLSVARQLPEFEFVVATNRIENGTEVPANVTASFVSREEFMHMMHTAAAVIVPLQQGLTRAVGQQTYLNAMYMGRPVIVTDTLAVRDHIEHKETGLVIDGSVESCVAALRWVFDPSRQDEVEQMCRMGQRVAQEKFTFENHVTCLLTIIDEAIAGADRRLDG